MKIRNTFISASDCLHITSFLRKEVEPCKDEWRRTFYSCAATLKDGTEIPRLMVRSEKETGDFYLRFLTSPNDRGEPYRSSMLRAWVTQGSRVSALEIAKVYKSKYALPGYVYSQFSSMGEVAMGANMCAVTMKDGEELVLGSSGVMPFYDFPSPYTGADIVSVRGARRDEPCRLKGLFSFETFIAWPEEEAE